MSGEHYPNAPGWKENDTSRAAAIKMRQPSRLLRDRILSMLDRLGPMSADECAQRMGEDILAIRPRFSELYKADKIERTGERRRNHSGMAAHVYKLKVAA